LQSGKPSIGGSLSQYGATVGVEFDGADWLMAKDAVCEQSASGSGKKVQGSESIAHASRRIREE
jgi:hypothetical protein